MLILSSLLIVSFYPRSLYVHSTAAQLSTLRGPASAVAGRQQLFIDQSFHFCCFHAQLLIIYVDTVPGSLFTTPANSDSNVNASDICFDSMIRPLLLLLLLIISSGWPSECSTQNVLRLIIIRSSSSSSLEWGGVGSPDSVSDVRKLLLLPLLQKKLFSSVFSRHRHALHLQKQK